MNLNDLKKKVARWWLSGHGVEQVPDSQAKLSNPLGLRIGSCFTLRSNVPTIYKTLFRKQEDYNVSAISIAQLTPTVKLFRFYDCRQFGATLTAGDNFLQVLVHVNTGEVLECRMFMMQEEVFPRSTEEWLKWIGEGSTIGLYDTVVGDRPFIRMEGWSDTDGDWSAPKTFTETVYENTDNVVENVAKHSAMQYGRYARDEASGVAEYAIISSVAVAANAQSRRFAFTTGYLVEGIGVYVGIDIPVTDVIVNF